MPDRVGVRQLRQNLSVYLDRVKEGRSLEVTEHGRPVALLTPLPGPVTAWARLVAEGLVIPATRTSLDLPLPEGPVSTRGADALQEQRKDRF